MSEQEIPFDQRPDVQKKWAKLVAKAWSDEEFKARLAADPVAVMKENGIDVPDDMEIKILEDTDTVKHEVIPFNSEEEAKGDA